MKFIKNRKDFLNEDYLSAIYNFMDCLEKDPYYVDAYFHRAMSIILLENTTETQLNLALVDMNVYLEARPKYADGYFGRGKINKQLKNKKFKT